MIFVFVTVVFVVTNKIKAVYNTAQYTNEKIQATNTIILWNQWHLVKTENFLLLSLCNFLQMDWDRLLTIFFLDCTFNISGDNQK